MNGSDVPPEEKAEEQLAAQFRRLRRTGDEALRNQLIERHLPLVKTLARKFDNRGEPLEDLIQQGTIGLIHAVDRYDPERGSKFATYATTTIVGEIRRYFRDHRWTLKVPRRLQELHLMVNRAVEALTQRLGHSPRIEDIAREVGASEEDILAAMEMGQAYEVISLEGDLYPEEGESSGRVVDGLGAVDQSLENYERSALLQEALATLEPRERRIIEYRFFEGLSQAEVAETEGISQMHVSRLQRRALAKLREFMERG